MTLSPEQEQEAADLFPPEPVVKTSQEQIADAYRAEIRAKANADLAGAWAAMDGKLQEMQELVFAWNRGGQNDPAPVEFTLSAGTRKLIKQALGLVVAELYQRRSKS